MNWTKMLSSPVGRKYVMGATGFFLILYLIIHASINALIFYNDDGFIFNNAAHFMSHAWFMRMLEIGLFAGFVIHIVQGLMLMKQNKAARPIGYEKQKYTKRIKWYSRFMGLLGTLILLFLIMHLSHFWYQTKEELYLSGPKVDLYQRMKEVFTNPVWFTLYMVGLISLLYHLLHGFQSAFRSLGMNDKTWTPIIEKAGVAYSVIIILLFASMPISFMVGWLQ